MNKIANVIAIVFALIINYLLNEREEKFYN